MTSQSSRSDRPAFRRSEFALPFVLIAALGWRLLHVLSAQLAAIRKTDALAQWDMAKYSLDGVRLADALRRGDPLAFLGHLNDMSVWPPLIALLEAPVFLLVGYGDEPPRIMMLVLFVLTIASVLWAGRALDPKDGWLIGALAAFFLLASPLHEALGALVMLEIPGTLLLLLCLGACWRAGPDSAGKMWRLTCILSTALFFCKYNYGLMWLIPLTLGEALHRTGSWRALGRLTLRRLQSVDWRRPSVLGLLIFAAALITIRLTGGWHIETKIFNLHATSIGNPLYALYLLILLRAAITPRRTLVRVSAWWKARDRRHRLFMLWTVMPIALWMLLPPHMKEFFGFLENRSSGLPPWQLDTWLYYPRALASHYAASPWTAWLIWPAVAGLLLRWPTLDWRRRILVMALVGYGLLPFFHPYKLPRFIFTATPLLWLATGEALSALTYWVRGKFAVGERSRQRTLGVVTLTLSVFLLLPGFDRERLHNEIASRSVSAESRPVLDELVEQLTPDGESIVDGVILGTWNLLSPPLIEWHLRRALPARNLPSWRSFCWRSERQVNRLFPAVQETPPVERVVTLERPISPQVEQAAYRDETDWLRPVYLRLASDPRWELISETHFSATDYQVRVYRWRGEPAAFPSALAHEASPPA